MNIKFTLEELELIHFTLEELALTHDNLLWSVCEDKNQKLLQLNRKLQDMIMNYCDHDCASSGE